MSAGESNLLSQGVSPELAERIPGIIAECKKHGLDPYELVIEEYNADEIVEIAAYGGFPVRYPHFSFGQQYQQLHNQYHAGMGKIYEMVINNDPTYMYLQRNNPLVDNLTVVAHALAHSDFFKNNIYFKNTNKNMMNIMATHGQKIRRYSNTYGRKRVATFLDSCLAIDDLIDPTMLWDDGPGKPTSRIVMEGEPHQYSPSKIKTKSYMDGYVNTKQYLKQQRSDHYRDKKKARQKYPPAPVRDILLFIMNNFRFEPWQQSILSMVREESVYFRPQMTTKVLNEGWASYWDSYIMTKCGFAGDQGIVEYAKHHSGVLGGKYAMNNPYRLGNCLLRHVEDRWNKGQYGRKWDNCDDEFQKANWDTKEMKGRDKIFEIRRDYNDVNFINEYFTQEFCDEHEYFEYELDPETNKYVVTSKDFDSIKEKLVKRYTNGGRPNIVLTDFGKDGITMRHKYDGLELEPKYVENTIKMMYNIVNVPIILRTKGYITKSAKTFGAIFAVAKSSQAELVSKVYKYDGKNFKSWSDYKEKDFPNSSMYDIG